MQIKTFFYYIYRAFSIVIFTLGKINCLKKAYLLTSVSTLEKLFTVDNKSLVFRLARLGGTLQFFNT